ncbi:MAG: DUF3455 domain-containing protein [Burkholderiales bacterium]|nr:DUF3455 domain-containing protein [Burkholderiales bacterium]
MQYTPSLPLSTLLAAVLATGCAGAPPTAAPMPPAIAAPAGQVKFMEAVAIGVQIYECSARPGAQGAFDWAFRAPEATLADPQGHPLGTHYAGPTWKAVDGSTVTAEVKGRDPGPDASAIPWLLLAAKTTTGAGALTPTRSIQRVQTGGGLAPARPCGAANAGEAARVPYTATYYFYRAA